jgi:hypothetical protein
MASSAIKLSEELINEARCYGEVYSRSVPKQIEYWSRIGRLAEENPDLSYSFLKEILLGIHEAAGGDLSPYQFG